MTLNKKGFTLIELMVVIVIIGILAAIAIPKLFGMSAKAKAQEVGPAAGTWVKLQQAYKMETGEFGGAVQISYELPGITDGTPADASTSSASSNFDYTVTKTNAESVKFSAKSKFEDKKCLEESEWAAALTTSNTPTMSITVASGGTLADCEALTPNFYKIGEKAGS